MTELSASHRCREVPNSPPRLERSSKTSRIIIKKNGGERRRRRWRRRSRRKGRTDFSHTCARQSSTSHRYSPFHRGGKKGDDDVFPRDPAKREESLPVFSVPSSGRAIASASLFHGHNKWARVSLTRSQCRGQVCEKPRGRRSAPCPGERKSERRAGRRQGASRERGGSSTQRARKTHKQPDCNNGCVLYKYDIGARGGCRAAT